MKQDDEKVEKNSICFMVKEEVSSSDNLMTFNYFDNEKNKMFDYFSPDIK